MKVSSSASKKHPTHELVDDLYQDDKKNPDTTLDSKWVQLKQRIISGWKDVKDILKTTSVEVALFAVLGIGVGIYHQTGEELKRSQKIPLAFSEIWEIERTAKKNNIELGAINTYEIKVNDMCMKIFEAYNDAQWLFLPSTEKFASNIYDGMNYNHIYKYNLKDLLAQVPSYVPQINKKLEKYTIINKSLNISNDNMSKAWDDTHTDNYHTEIRTRTVTDSKGNSTTETYTEEVYDDTTHDYEYNKTSWEEAAKNLTELFTKVPTIQLEEKILKTSITNAEGEYAADKSREKTSAKERLTQEQLLAVANTWYTGSTLLKNINIVNAQYPKLGKSAIDRNTAKGTAHDETYNTYSHFDDGPKEFQVGKNTLDLGMQINDNLKEIQQVINTTHVKVPLLESKIKKFVEVGYVKYSSSSKEAKELAEEIMTLTKEIYKMNFKEGINVDRFRWGMIFLFALIGGVVWWLAWMGLDRLDNKIGVYDRIKFLK